MQNSDPYINTWSEQKLPKAIGIKQGFISITRSYTVYAVGLGLGLWRCNVAFQTLSSPTAFEPFRSTIKYFQPSSLRLWGVGGGGSKCSTAKTNADATTDNQAKPQSEASRLCNTFSSMARSTPARSRSQSVQATRVMFEDRASRTKRKEKKVKTCNRRKDF